MAIQNDYPVLDGIAPSWADIIVKAKPNGGSLVELKDIAALNTGSSVEVGEQRGASGGRVMKRTTGAVSYEASITFYRDGYDRFIESLAALAPVRGSQKVLSLVHFLIEVQHTPIGSDRIFQYRLKGCRIMGDTLNHAEGTDADQVEVPLSVIERAHVLPDGSEAVML